MKFNILFFINFLLIYNQSLAQIDEFYSFGFPQNENSNFLTIREMEENKALIFSIENYFSVPATNIRSFLTKVNYEGESEIFTSVELDLYDNVMVFEGYFYDNSYILLSMALNKVDNKSYFITLESDLNLTSFTIIDRIELEYSFFNSLHYSFQYDKNKNLYYFPFSIGERHLVSQQDLFFTLNPDGQVVEHKILNLERNLIQDYWYSAVTEKHYLTASDNFTVLDSDLNVVHSSLLQFNFDDEYIFLGDYRIIHAENNIATFIGRKGSKRELYILKIYIKEGSDFDVISFNELNNSIGSHYLLRKVKNSNDQVYISSTIDALDIPEDVPNINYIWELNHQGEIVKTYELNHNIKTSIGLRSIGNNNELLGLGVESITNRKFYFVLKENNRFLVSTNEIESEVEYMIKLFPNPTSEYLTIETKIDEALRFKIYNIDGFTIKTGEVILHHTVEMDNLTSGNYLIEFYNTKNKKVSVHKIIVVK